MGGNVICRLQNGKDVHVNYKNVGDVGMFTSDVVHEVTEIKTLPGKRELLILRVQFPPSHADHTAMKRSRMDGWDGNGSADYQMINKIGRKYSGVNGPDSRTRLARSCDRFQKLKTPEYAMSHKARLQMEQERAAAKAAERKKRKRARKNAASLLG